MLFIDVARASSEAAEAVENVAEQGLLASLGLNGQLFIFQLINFVVVAIILWYLILKPVTKKMADRQKMIDESIHNAKKIQDNLARGERDYQMRIDSAKVEANKIIEKASAETILIAENTKNKAKKEIETAIELAKRNIKTEKEDMVHQLKEETVDLIIKAMEKILGEKISEKKDKELIEASLKKLKEQM